MIEDQYISLAHGNGGRYMRELIAEIFARHLSEPDKSDSLDVTLDAAPIALGEGEPYMTTDGFIVQPLEFPGGDIGSLAVNGTVNDLAVSGATPKYLSLNAFIEEGLRSARSSVSSEAWRQRRKRQTCRSSRATPRSCRGAKAAACTWRPREWVCGRSMSISGCIGSSRVTALSSAARSVITASR